MDIWYRLKVCISRSHWKRHRKDMALTFGTTLGVAWTIVRILEHYFPHMTGSIPLWIVVSPAVLIAGWTYWPNLSVKYRLHGRDVWIEIRVDNIFSVPGAMVISTNSTFETRISDGPISRHSLQGQFTTKYYKDREEDLIRDLRASLENTQPISRGNRDIEEHVEYELGTVAKIRSEQRTVYMIAVARMNEHGTASSSPNSVSQVLGRLWHYIGTQGELEPLSVPILGTGRARMMVQREEMVRQIIDSFVAACSEKKFCDELVVVISKFDYHKFQMDLQELGDYLYHTCRYTTITTNTNTGEGQEAP